MSFDTPNVVLPLASSYNGRGIAGFTNVVTNGLDQRKINSIYEPINNQLSGKTTLYLVKRPGVVDTGSSYGTSGQVSYLSEIAAGATTNAAANRWVFSTSGNDIRASDTSTTTVVATASGYAPTFVDKTSISSTDTLVLQLRNASGTQTAWYSTTIGTFTQISDSDFTSLAHQGKMEFMDGYAFISTRDKIFNSDLNSLSSWVASSYISRLATQDIATGLGKLGQQIISWGTATMEVFKNAGNATGSPLVGVSSLAKSYGMPSTIVTGQRHYYVVLDDILYWVGSNPHGVFAYNGERVEKVSSPAIDKILAERQFYFVSSIGFQGKKAVSIGLDTPSATTQRSLLFFPDWKDWFEWQSTVFIPQASPRLENVLLGVGSNQHKLYSVSVSSDNWQDAGTDYTWAHQFMIPSTGNQRKKMPYFGLKGTTASSTQNISVQFSDDYCATFSTARTIDASTRSKCLTRCGSWKGQRHVKLSHSGNSEVRIEAALMRIE